MKQIVLAFCLVSAVQFFFNPSCPAQSNNVYSLHKLLTLSDKPVERFRILNNISETTGLNTGLLDSANCVQLLQIAQELNDDSLLAISYNLIGQYMSRVKGDNTNGMEYYFKAIPLAEKSRDRRRLSSIYFDISLIYFTLQNPEEAVKYVRKGGASLPAKAHPLYDFMLAQYQRGMATYFVMIHQPDSALAYTQPLAATSRKINSPLFEFSALFLSGAAYDQLGEREIAGSYFRKAILVSDSVQSVYGILRFGTIYIPFLLKNKQFPDALVQAHRLLSVGEQLGNNDLKLASSGFIRQAYDSLHNTDSAYFYSKMETKINALIFNQNNLNKMQALAFDEKIRIMEEEDRLADEAEKRRIDIQYALIFLGIVTFVIVFFILSNSIIVTERLISFLAILGLLIVFEFINLLLHPFLEKITHHTPVLILLALVGIASMLIPLHHRLEHWIKERMTQKNKRIRLRAAKKTIEQLES